MIRRALKFLALLVGACAFPSVCFGGRGPRARHQRSLAARHGQHPRQSAGPVSTGGSSQFVRGAVDTARRSRQDRIVLRCDRGVGAGAEGLFQFEPATFAAYAKPTPPGGAAPPTPFDPTDAAYAAARYLCSLGVADNPTLALVAYNCGNPGPACQAASAGYAQEVLATAASYTAPGGVGSAGASGVQAAAVSYAESQIGTPYVYGGDEPPDRVRLLRTGGLGLWTGRGGRAPGSQRPVARRAPRCAG